MKYVIMAVKEIIANFIKDAPVVVLKLTCDNCNKTGVEIV